MRIVVLLVGLAVVASSRTADACECGSSRYASPSMDVPLRGALYVRDELGFRRETLDFTWEGTPGIASARQVSPTTVRIDYEGPPGSTLFVASGIGHAYRLRPDWQRPADPPIIGSAIHWVYEWEADFANFDFDRPTVAIRVRWTFEGLTHEWIDVQRTLTHGPEMAYSLAIGDLHCGGERWIAEELWEGGSLELFAIHADGTEMRIDTPVFFSTASLPQALHGKWPDYVADSAWGKGVGFEPPIVDVRDHARTRDWMLLAPALLLVMASLLRMSPTRTAGLSSPT